MSAEPGIRSRPITSKGLPVASIRLVVLFNGANEKGPDPRPHLGIGIFEWFLECCQAIDLRTAIETERKG